MSLARSLSFSSALSKINDNKSVSKFNLCKVCGDKARIVNYGALSCQPCKTFFRRNGFRPQNIRSCQINGQCEINIETRTVYTSCRLAKCLAAGMSTDLIRKEDLHRKVSLSTTKSKQSQISQRETIMPVYQLPTLDLLFHDRSSLTTSDWILFSNVVHAYDTFSMIPTLNYVIQQLSSSLCRIHFNTADAVAAIGSVFKSMQAFIRCTPDFQVLSMNEQQSLFGRNLHGVGSFCTYLAFRDACVFDNYVCYKSYDITYGSTTMERSFRLTKRLDLDSTLFKLMFVIIAFSSNCCIVNIDGDRCKDSFLVGTYRLFGSQNVYVELLWKYMIYRYGYYEAVRRFAGLIKGVLDMISDAAITYVNNEIHHRFVDEVIGKVNETLIITRNEPVGLWGKTLPSI